ncbi:MAG: sensor histidine kinase [Candidatus Sumerlaeaceae bacterium]|nr:sensor histidine kinase [Candidatus Sumerlaeaceae bacterium]
MHSTAKFDYSRRTRILNAVVTTLYFLILALVLYELDRQHYTGEKENLIREHFREIFHLPDSLAEYAGDVLFAPTPAMRKAAADRLREEMQRIVEGPTSIFSFELQDASRQVVDGLRVVDPEKPKRLQNWRNCLFLRNFERITDLGVRRERGAPGAGRLVARYTTPANYPPIEELTRRYWMICGALVLVWAAGYYFLYRYILRPMHNVTIHLQGAQQARPRLIARPAAGLEAAYNEMARRALIQELDEKMSELLKKTDRPTADGQVIQGALELVASAFDTSELHMTEFYRQNEEIILFRTYSVPAKESATENETGYTQARELAQEVISRSPSVTLHRTHPNGTLDFAANLGNSIVVMTARLADPSRDMPLRLEGLRLACDSITRGLLAFSALESSISEQRQQANISLARCIGHDLTNVLASVRLNTSTARDLLQRHPQDITDQEWEILREVIEAIADTMRLMQDIVDLYSSFGSIRRPVYKRWSLDALVSDLISKFERTTSLRVVFQKEIDPNLPMPVVERRLLMLALFNVLTNALDAFRSMRAHLSASPRIVVRVRYDATQHCYRIEVEDNGPGIRDASGRLLARGEIEQIFHHGYSTKADSSEGFGLYWVRTIVESFHGGVVNAENLPEGGARFTLVIRSMEEREARVGDATVVQ